ncbi:MAG: class I SAM-dependent methyltransferase [Actinobacteria bacterium]|nr:MAG: class I SAM-dependent methyltransferase [Actinomycetota bacterium]
MTNPRAEKKRAQFVPWQSAGNRTETDATADEVVRSTGWVFNNETGSELTLEEFVATGDKEVKRYMHQFGFGAQRLAPLTLLEIGSGIGRMTASFTQQCAHVVAADVDAAFLERCRETVGKHGRVDRLTTTHVQDGSTLSLADNSVDVAFSYITLQHCQRSDALGLTREAVRVTRDGGTVTLNFRSWVLNDVALIPLGILVRMLWRVPVVGKRISAMRWATRFGWQANRLSPDEVLQEIIDHSPKSLSEITIYHSPFQVRRVSHGNAQVKSLKRVNRSHWWLVATVSGS